MAYLTKHPGRKFILGIGFVGLVLLNLKLVCVPIIVSVGDGGQVLPNKGCRVALDAGERVSVSIHCSGQSASLYVILEKTPFDCFSIG